MFDHETLYWNKQRTKATSLFMSILQGNQFQVFFLNFGVQEPGQRVLVKVGMPIPRMPVGGKGYRDPGLKIEWSLCWLFLLEEAPKFLKDIYWRWLWNSRQMLGKLPWSWKMIPSNSFPWWWPCARTSKETHLCFLSQDPQVGLLKSLSFHFKTCFRMPATSLLPTSTTSPTNP